MSDHEPHTDGSHRAEDDGRTTPTAPEGRIEALAAENRALREQVAALEDSIAEIRDAIEDESQEQGGATDVSSTGASAEASSETPTLLPSGGQQSKVIGQIDESSGGIGVRGHNTASSGSTYGVWGEVDSGDGYGLYTPDDARVEGAVVASAESVSNPQDDGVIRTNSSIHLDYDGSDTVKQIYLSDTSGNIFYNPNHNGKSLVGIDDCDEFRLLDAMTLRLYGGTITFDDLTRQRTAGPVAKGNVTSSGSIRNAVNVDSVTWDSGLSLYRVELSEDDFRYDEYATYVTNVGSTGGVSWSINSNNGQMLVYPGDESQHDFMFVTHKLVQD